ncbi:hypothetical protein [Flavobacterium sp.]|uniref:hypothetical protein n=1 Tax=Flavobacterium sp. TaxID=239 RepID=UPI0031D8991F
MKKIILFAILLVSIVGYSQEKDCKKFKNGKYYSSAFPDQYIIRKDSIEETYTDGKLGLVWDVKWLSDCKYELVCKKNYGTEPVPPGYKLVYTIFATEGDCYYMTVFFKNEKYPQGSTFQRGVCLMND